MVASGERSVPSLLSDPAGLTYNAEVGPAGALGRAVPVSVRSPTTIRPA